MEFRDLHEFGQFFFQNDAFKFQDVFSELGIRVFLENISYFTDLRQTGCAKKMCKTSETTYTLDFVK
jgi:hypothetical protein